MGTTALLGLAQPAAGAPAGEQSAPAAPTVVASAWSGGGAVATASCPSGMGLVGGGMDTRLVRNLAGEMIDGVELNAPNPSTPNTWQVQAHLGQARAFAMCSPDAPTPTVVAGSWSANTKVAKVTCPSGTQLVGGGQDARLARNVLNQVVDGVELNAPDATTPNTWQVQLHLGQARAFAMCLADAPTPTVVVSNWSSQAAVGRVSCPSGTQLIGGGVDSRLSFNGFNQVVDDIEANTPDPDRPNTWKVQAHHGSTRAFAMCTADAPTPVVIGSPASANGAVARATCPEGTTLAGGGQDGRLSVNGFNQVNDAFELNGPDPGTSNTWQVQVDRGQARAIVMCTS